jgi:cyclopropane-fatty-acyl-phospholipid synthase
MSGSSNLAPSSYVGPQGPLEWALCRHLIHLMIASKRIAIARGVDDGCVSEAEFILAPPRLWTLVRILIAPNLWVGESYAAGSWYLRKGSLTEFLDVIQREAPRAFQRYYEFTAALRGFRYYRGQYLLNVQYTRKVRQHYEVDATIYEMILDREMVYTCGFFETADQDLDVAQQNKLAVAIARLELPEGSAKVLDIGCGWGATARAIVRSHEHAEVCGLSISEGQIEWARERDCSVLSANQLRRIDYRAEDYVNHNVTQSYDAAIVIGMIEHVGLGGYETFFRRLYGFLKFGGTAVIHTIAAPTPGKPANPWIDKKIFTGGHAPSVSELVRAIERQPFQITGLYIYRSANYRRTIECWIHNFISNEPLLTRYMLRQGAAESEVEQFIRTWLFYLSGVRNMFSDGNRRSYQVVQVCIRKK